jgi:coenzyme PQQ synthesis protein D (PqqD)
MFDIARHVRCAPSDQGIVLFDFKASETLTLNMVGSFIWQRLQDGDSFVSIVQELSVTTGADVAQVEWDTWEFIEHLTSRGLVARTTRSRLK